MRPPVAALRMVLCSMIAEVSAVVGVNSCWHSSGICRACVELTWNAPSSVLMAFRWILLKFLLSKIGLYLKASSMRKLHRLMLCSHSVLGALGEIVHTSHQLDLLWPTTKVAVASATIAMSTCVVRLECWAVVA